MQAIFIHYTIFCNQRREKNLMTTKTGINGFDRMGRSSLRRIYEIEDKNRFV